MRRRPSQVMCLLAVGALIAAAIQVQSTDGAKPPTSNAASRTTPDDATGDKFIVHEWGTFTSFSGSDGVKLEYRPLLDEDLPAFVLDRFLQSGTANVAGMKALIRSRLRMETPVTYFYTDKERDVNVRVGFPEGLLTEFYPPVQNMGPDFKFGESIQIKNSFLDWGKVHLIPQDRFSADVDNPERKKLLESRMLNGLIPPDNGSHNHYFHARDVDAAVVQVRVDPLTDPAQRKRFPRRPVGDFFEKFLFYRGVGNFDLPLDLKASGDDRFVLKNSSPDEMRSLFLVTVDGKSLRFAKYDRIGAGEQIELEQSTEVSSIDALSESVVGALVDEGLYQKEAVAMVKTWQRSWFGEQGTRLFYMVPERITDELLPLQVSPRPDETVRVLVGRMEIMTPEDESAMIDLVRDSAARRQADYKAAKAAGKQPGYKLPKELSRWGRMAEPALVRVRATTKDRTVRYEAKALLASLQQIPH